MNRSHSLIAVTFLTGSLAAYTTTTAWTTYFESSEPVETIINKTANRVESCGHPQIIDIYNNPQPYTNVEATLATCDSEVQEYIKKSQAWSLYLQKKDYNNENISWTINYYEKLMKNFSEISPEAQELVKNSLDWQWYVIWGYSDNYQFTSLTIYSYSRLIQAYSQLSPEYQKIVRDSPEWKEHVIWRVPDRSERTLRMIEKMNHSSSWGGRY